MSFPRLVQPVLDKNCVACHAENADKAPPLDGNTFVLKKNEEGQEERHRNPYGWSNGYQSLYKMGWGKHGGVNSHIRANKTTYTVPGDVGAQASELLKFLQKGHNDVKPDKEELYKITLWLDLNTNYYGSYHEEEAQSRGELVLPRLGMPEELPPGILQE